MAYSFRIRFKRSPSDMVNIESSMLEFFPPETGNSLVLHSYDSEKKIKESRDLVLRSSGWLSEQEAVKAGERYQDALMLTLARLRVGADFGNRAPKAGFFRTGLAMLERQSNQRVVNDVHGMMVYETEPQPRFARLGTPTVVRGTPCERFKKVFSHAIDHPRDLSEREALSLDLFNASFFEKSADTRFLTLVMAIEALVEPRPRDPVSQQHVNELITLTQNSLSLSPSEKDSLSGSLKWLLQESINQAGRRLASERLGSRTYLDRNPAKFFSYVYDLRSRLVHGSTPRPSREKISNIAAQLEVFVSDLLSGPLLEVDL